jgi:hypothetical protein
VALNPIDSSLLDFISQHHLFPAVLTLCALGIVAVLGKTTARLSKLYFDCLGEFPRLYEAYFECVARCSEIRHRFRRPTASRRRTRGGASY